MSSLAFIGATGKLGQEIAPGLKTAEGFDRFLAVVRPESITKEPAKHLQELGYELVSCDVSDTEALEKVLQGCKVVVSTLSKGQLHKLETGIVDASKKAGVSLFVPSQFGVDLERFGASHPVYQAKVKVIEKAEQAGLPVLKVYTGFFSDIIFDVLADPWEGTARLVGDPADAPPVSFTRRSDVGYVLAKALADPAYSDGGVLAMAGTTCKWKEGLDLLASITGKEFEYTTISVEEAEKEQTRLIEEGEEELNLRKNWAAFSLHLLTVTGSGNHGVDTSAIAKNYGHEMEPLDVTLNDVYIHPDDKGEGKSD
mmetsp:Transcript_481/g.1101  ORF Transcript_481/g.1101 Transcript_481/m.1101 type:complete len:312 (-) Transcript_481:191-1126(-)|eukprot:scaffold426_cov219-Amphora_coffeaeformis.AAC.39